MCLAIPGKIVEIGPEVHLATVEVSAVRRKINIDLLRGEALGVGVARLAEGPRQFRIMEVCGGHTHAIYRFALEELLPPHVELIHGPRWAVCVLPIGRIC